MGRCYPHRSLEERRKIDKWRAAKMPIPEIADRLGRAPSPIYRELKRNYLDDKELPELNGYHALNAHARHETRRAIHRKMIVHPALKAAIEDRLKEHGPQGAWKVGVMSLVERVSRLSYDTSWLLRQKGDAARPAIYGGYGGPWRARIRGGRSSLRKALYMPALVALRFTPDLKQEYQSLKGAGKPSKVAITAIMRKLLVLANALLRDDRKWNDKAT